MEMESLPLFCDIPTETINEYGYDIRASFINVFEAIVLDTPNCLEDVGIFSKSRHPIFFGCYDWHSSVHSYLCLFILLDSMSKVDSRNDDVQRLVLDYMESTLTSAHADIELESMKRQSDHWECPYGLAWFLKLYSYLHTKHSDLAAPLSVMLAEVQDRLFRWMLTLDKDTADRSGLHGNAAYSLLLIIEACDNLPELSALRWCALDTSQRVFIEDVLKSDEDISTRSLAQSTPGSFLSPTLCEAELVAKCYRSCSTDSYVPIPFRNMSFAEWVVTAVDTSVWYCGPKTGGDPSDKSACHICGLNLSRAASLATLAGILLPSAVQAHLEKEVDMVSTYARNEDIGFLPNSLFYSIRRRGAPLITTSSNRKKMAALSCATQQQTAESLAAAEAEARPELKKVKEAAPLQLVRWLMSSAIKHYQVGLPYLNSGHFMGDHWLNTFAVRAIEALYQLQVMAKDCCQTNTVKDVLDVESL